MQFSTFENFMSMFLSLRDHSTDIYVLSLHKMSHFMSHNLYVKIIEYARLFTECPTLSNQLLYYSTPSVVLLFISHFDLVLILRSHSFNFPALTTLSLKHIAFCCNDYGCVDPFSAFNKLNTSVYLRIIMQKNFAFHVPSLSS